MKGLAKFGYFALVLGSIATLTCAGHAQTTLSPNDYAYKRWSDWRIYHIGDKPEGYAYVLLYKAADGACALQTLDITYAAETHRCGEDVDGWGKIDTLNGTQTAAILPTSKKNKRDSYQVVLSNPRAKSFHDKLAEIHPKLVSDYDRVVAKLQAIDPNAPPDGYPLKLTVDRVSRGTFRYDCGIAAHSVEYAYELHGRSESDCDRLPAPHQTYWSRESQQSALSVVLLNDSNHQDAMQYVDIVLESGVDEYHGGTSVKKTTFVIISKSSM